MEGQKVYVPDKEHIWLPAVVVSFSGSNVEVKIADDGDVKSLGELVGTVREVDLTDKEVVQMIASHTVSTGSNAKNLPLQNEMRKETGIDDMIDMNHLHEAAILYNLRRRFFKGLPYTYTGKICIAVNPYQWLDLYSKDLMHTYNNADRDGLTPHVYSTSSDAFYDMFNHSINQSILVSGESGAGKTETTKIMMAHLAHLSRGHDAENQRVIQQVIEANPLLESFGNAKTIRNDNSSRFGKFTELQFNIEGVLVGAKSRTYLLEKSRVIYQAPGERNFHFFYQLLAVAGDYPQLQLRDTTYKLVREDPTITKQSSVNKFKKTWSALDIVGISSADREEMLKVVASVLHVGEIEVAAKNGDVDSSTVVSTDLLKTVGELLGCDAASLENVICNRTVVVGREKIKKPMTATQAADTRDALAKALYAKLFDWLVSKVNDLISAKRGAKQHVGILDIFGFEHFEQNSFEQFCINYANEKLQQKFTQDVLKTIQEEYEEEGISWDHVEFADNQDVLDMIEGRLGVISMLNEEALLQRGTDQAFAHKLATVMSENPLFTVPRLDKCAFTVAHYAGKVQYNARGFLEKHRDSLLPDVEELMVASSNRLVSAIFKLKSEDDTSKGRSKGQLLATTVATQFKNNLSELMAKISATNVYYVRCIKPNSLKSPDDFEHPSVINQLRCAGVVEAIRVSRSAYPNSMPHNDALMSFAMLAPGGMKALEEARQAVDQKGHLHQLMVTLLPGRDIIDFQVGRTKIYFREGVLEALEIRRGEALKAKAVLIQKIIRGYVYRQRFLRMRRATCKIQATYRMHYTRKRYKATIRGFTRLQAVYRGRKARRLYYEMRMRRLASLVQAFFKAVTFRKRFLQKRRACIKIQSQWRRVMATRKVEVVRKDREEEKVRKQKLENLKNALKYTAAPQTAAGKGLGPVSPPIVEGSAAILEELENENSQLKKQVEELQQQLSKMREENGKLREWQKSKAVDESVKQMSRKQQEGKDAAYADAVEKQYESLRSFLVERFKLPTDAGTPARYEQRVNKLEKQGGSRTDVNDGERLSESKLQRDRSISKTTPATPGDVLEPSGNADEDKIRSEVLAHLRKGERSLARAKQQAGPSHTRRIRDQWEEITNFPPPMEYSLGSVPWKRLLTDWAQGNPKKLDYMTRWLKNVLDGAPIPNPHFPMGVELKSVTPMMLDGFIQLVIPKLAERRDIRVHVHTKEFIGTSMRITLTKREGGRVGDESVPASALPSAARMTTLLGQNSQSDMLGIDDGKEEGSRQSFISLSRKHTAGSRGSGDGSSRFTNISGPPSSRGGSASSSFSNGSSFSMRETGSIDDGSEPSRKSDLKEKKSSRLSIFSRRKKEGP